MGAIVGLAAVVGGVVLVAASGITPPEPGGHDLQVDLPDVVPPAAAGFRRPEVSCEPPGCQRWSVEVGHGRTRALMRSVYHTTRDTLLAIDPEHGDIRWRTSLRRPDARLMVAGDHLEAAETRWLFTSDREALQAWDSGTGELRWEVEWPESSHVVDIDLIGDQLLFGTSGALPRLDHENGRDAWPGRSGVVALAADSGDPLWSTEVDRVVDLSPHVLVLSQGVLVALDPATGRPRWSYPAAAASTNEVGDEVAVADAAGVAILDADTGAVRDRLETDPEGVMRPPGERPSAGFTETLRLGLHGLLLSVAGIQDDDPVWPSGDSWDLTLYDRTDGSELARYATALTWSRSDNGLLLVLAASDGDLFLDAVSTTEASQIWSRPLRAAATSGARLEEQPTGELFISLFVAQDEVEVVSLDHATGHELARYGGAGWEAIGDGILASGSSEPVVGSVNVTRLAGPQGSVAFSRPVTLVSTRPLVVEYWGTLIRVDDRLLTDIVPR